MRHYGLKACNRSVFPRLILGQRDAGVTEEFPQYLDGLLVADVAVVRMVQADLDPVQHDAETGAMRGFDGGAEVVEERLDLPPVDVAAEGILKDRA